MDLSPEGAGGTEGSGSKIRISFLREQMGGGPQTSRERRERGELGFRKMGVSTTIIRLTNSTY